MKIYRLPKVFSDPPSPCPSSPAGGRGKKRQELLASAIILVVGVKRHIAGSSHLPTSLEEKS
jgi:hypothetical protein